MKKLLCLLLTIILISLTGCGSSNVDNNTDILVNEAGSEKKNASEMQEPMENTGDTTIFFVIKQNYLIHIPSLSLFT